ncbi:putative mannan endo-1,4-beta-mannosidase F [Leucoagaricus sp. SymC.cos]|nr:putative mannan endo-1,4-beta-mannosidase F [Leucoagaricus sp. SymC.cos]
MQHISVVSTLLGLATLTPLAAAQVGAWGQCGGNGWTGQTTCVSGYTCVVQNEWYSQCAPGAASSTTTSKTASAPTSTPTVVAKANYWFSFGDSYTQTGFSPSSTLPSPGNILGNPPYPGWTSSGGENWLDYVASQYNKSLLLTYNYAYGGATIDANLVPPYTSTVLSLTDQVNQFLSGAGSKPASTPWTSSNSLFSVWIGINDIGNSWYQPGDRDAFSDTLLNAYFALVQKLYHHRSNVGARNFLFLNVPPVDRSPLMLASDPTSQATEAKVITTFNSKLAAKISSFKANNTGVTTYLYDSHTQFETILDAPTQYGFKDATSYGDDPTLFWINNLHPTYPAHKLFAQTIKTVLASSIF